MVAVSIAVMKPLLDKLATLMGDEFAKLKNLRKEVKLISDELTGMKDALEELSHLDELDRPTTRWRDKVREMSYDTEDIIDDFMLNFRQSNKNIGFFSNTINRLKTLRARHNIGGQIKEIKALALEASAWRQRYTPVYKPDTPPSFNVAMHSRVVTLYEDAANLVGVEEPTNELVNLLADEDKQLKMVSIVGFGGLGKSTLANVVLMRLKGRFHQTAFVSVSQKPNIPKLLYSLLFQLGDAPPSNDLALNVLIDILRKRLQHKRYFIVMDDIWDVQAWDVIKCAFPQNNLGSRVIVTTRIQDVAKACCLHGSHHILEMKPLSNEDSRTLFLGRIFGSEEACPRELWDISVEILKRCGGLPLAIITISSMLASENSYQMERWEHVRDSLGSITNLTLEKMRQILNLSYKDLPSHLKSCFLYLGMYPEDYKIDKYNLQHQWIAEGFITKENGQDVEKVARSYFNELVNRSLIQPIYFDKRGSVTTCKVHDMMLDLILIKSAEDNFFTIVDNQQAISGLDCKIRRLSIRMKNFSSTMLVGNIGMSQVRSLMVFGDSGQNVPSFSEFKFLRVFCTDCSSFCSYVGLCKLYHLRYLETLHLHMMVYKSYAALLLQPYGIGHIKSLRHLTGFEIDKNSLDNIKGLGELANLRYLSLICRSYLSNMEKPMDALCSSLGRLGSLEDLLLVHGAGCIDGLFPLSPPPTPYRLQTLLISEQSWFSIVPSWMGRLRNLCELQCGVMELLNDGASILAELPALSRLNIQIGLAYYHEKIVISGSRAFPALECLNIEVGIGCPSNMTLQAGAMPRLQRLNLKFDGRWLKQDGVTVAPAGMEHLLALQELSAQIVCETGAPESDKTSIESGFRSAIAMNPRHPLFGIKFLEEED
ncbi:disease resistance protein RGA5-like [Lolium perenne]|uniref:disease resistance protein RGA5-like n=1 Tax=Lolium perenne TaxID=4522 RepID=UPI003A993132